MALAVAVAVPAMAAPSQWHAMPSFSSFFNDAEAKAVSPLGFEIAGESFPGSAFYYLADDPYAPASGMPSGVGRALIAPLSEESGSPAAQSMRLGGSAIDKARALQCMTLAIYYEAATESDAGQRAVAQVVLNRVAHPTYPNTVCGVVFQGSERTTGCQFSFTCDGSMARQPARQFWDRARRVALSALSGIVYRPVGLATHYHTVQIHPYWADSLNNITTIGAHTFYRWKGSAGRPAAFTDLYAGGEPLPARHTPSRDADKAPVADPVELARIYEQQLAAGRIEAAPYAPLGAAPAPTRAAVTTMPATPAPPPSYSATVEARGGDSQYTGNRLPGAGEVRSEYAQSGQWIAK